MIPDERVRQLNDRPVADRLYVVYWMQAAQRAECNHALEYAIRRADSLGKPLIVYFGVTDDFPEANARHYRFMLEGLIETKAALAKRGIRMLVRHVSPDQGALELAADAALMVTDRGYLRIERAWRARVAEGAPCPVVQVETNAVVPVETASPREEYSAATLRPKIRRLLSAFMQPLGEKVPCVSSLHLELPFEEFVLEDIESALGRLDTDRSMGPAGFTGGSSRAKAALDDFIINKLAGYPELKNDPALGHTSGLSLYLHFGQISPLYVCLRLADAAPGPAEAFTEELVVRRELAMNFVLYNEHYDSMSCLPAWARAALDRHRADPRPYLYSLQQLENAETHDPYWNAAQTEMALTGKMAGYMRMYWGKKILEWARTPEEAWHNALYLNNRCSLDGRDPNGFAGVAWCFGKHDRPWGERPVSGTVRYMNAAGLERKFDMKRYLDRVASL